MAFEEERKLFSEFVKSRGLKQSDQRNQILVAFLKTEKHLSAEELHNIVRRTNPSIGIATVYRTLKLFLDSGLCRELRLDDGTSRYEHQFGHDHHDHLVCSGCGTLVEVFDPEIEKLQEKLAARHGFQVSRHKLEMYGLCKSCRK